MPIEALWIAGTALGALLTFWPHAVQKLMLAVTPHPMRWFYEGKKAIFGYVGFGIFLLLICFVRPLWRVVWPDGG